jgi:hypothetical protein
VKLTETIIDFQGKKIGSDYATYLIADIAANYDADLLNPSNWMKL